MKRITFKHDNAQHHAFVQNVRKRVHAYFKDNKLSIHGNRKMHLKTAVMLSLYLLPFIAILTLPIPGYLAILLAILIGIGEAGVGMCVMHDASHGAYSKNKITNKLFASTMFLLGSNTFNWKIQHNVKHHTFTNLYNHDPDISTKAVIRLSEHAPLKRYHKYQHIYAFLLYGLMTIVKLFQDLFELLQYNKEGLVRQHKASLVKEVIKLIAVKIIYLGATLALPYYLTSFTFPQIILGFVIVHFTAGMIMSTVFQMAHIVEGTYQPKPDKDNIIYSDWMVHEVLSTADFGRKKGFLSWYTGGLNYQVEHHLFPYICHVHYPEISGIVQNTAQEFGVDYNLKESFGKALVSHYYRLKELGTLKHS